jgi:hypothetical protein
MFPLEASDDYGIEGLPDRKRLILWLESWLKDEDSRTCKLQKLRHFDSETYTESN